MSKTKPILFSTEKLPSSWDEWLEVTEDFLKNQGYRKYVHNYNNEDFTYWKVFKVNKEEAYQIGILFYDFRKYDKIPDVAKRIGIQFECMIIDTEDRIDLSVSKDITLEQFETMASKFYEAMGSFKEFYRL